MLEGVGQFVQSIIDNAYSVAFKIAKIPFNLWNSLPAWVHTLAAIIIISIAILFAWGIWKLRSEWRYRA